MIRYLIFYWLTLHSFAVIADTNRYPYDNFAYAGETGGIIETNHEDERLYLALRYDPTYTRAQKAIIKRATGIFLERALSPAVIGCAFSTATKDFIHNDSFGFQEQMFEALKSRHIGDLQFPAHLYIARYWGEDDTVGIAYIDLFYKTDFPLPGYADRHYFHVALNSDFIGPKAEYRYGNDEEYWAGVIAHEVLHNLGYIHPTGATGSFIKEYGNCIASNGFSGDSPVGSTGDRVVHDLEM